jgi:hypothetical protein
MGKVQNSKRYYSEKAGAASRSSRYFEAQEGGFIIGGALAFYSVPEPD